MKRGSLYRGLITSFIVSSAHQKISGEVGILERTIDGMNRMRDMFIRPNSWKDNLNSSQLPLLLLLLYTRLKAVSSRYEDVAKDQNTRDHLA